MDADIAFKIDMDQRTYLLLDKLGTLTLFGDFSEYRP